MRRLMVMANLQLHGNLKLKSEKSYEKIYIYT